MYVCLCKSQFEHLSTASSLSTTCLHSHFCTPSRLIITKILCHCFATDHSLTNLKMQMNAKLHLNLNCLLLPLFLFVLLWEKKGRADIKCWWWKSIFQIWGNFEFGPAARNSDIIRAARLIHDLRRNCLDLILPLSFHRGTNAVVFSSFTGSCELKRSHLLGRGVQEECEQMHELKHSPFYCLCPNVSN